MGLLQHNHSNERRICSTFAYATPSAIADKLLQTKLREKEIKDALKDKAKLERDASIAAKAETHAMLKEERMTHDTRRAAKDKREVGWGIRLGFVAFHFIAPPVHLP